MRRIHQPNRHTDGNVSLDTIQILDSESDEMAESVIKEAPIQIPEEQERYDNLGNQELGQEAVEASSMKARINQDERERRYVKQGVFIDKFMQELRVNESFDKLQKAA